MLQSAYDGRQVRLTQLLLSKIKSTWLCLTILLAFGAPGRSEGALDLKRIEPRIVLAAHALQELLKSDGSFIYETTLDGRPVKSQYNLVRHAGAVYALDMFETRWLSPTTRWDIESGLDFLKQNARPLSEYSSERMVALPSWSGNDKDTTLGATALAVVAFLAAGSRRPTAEEADLIRSMGNFLLSMQKPDGSFYSRYGFARALRDDSFNSLYYPGEAALALVDLYSWDDSPDRKIWGMAALRGLLNLATSRAASADYPPDNWALTATRALLEAGVAVTERERNELIAHAERIVESDLEFQATNDLDPRLDGALTDTGSPTQTSTRLEGLLAALSFIRNPQLSARAKSAVEKATAFLLRTQIQDGPLEGAFPETIVEDPARRRPLIVRIDYIQHALAALILYRDSLRSKD
jgi:hypothetical protein